MACDEDVIPNAERIKAITDDSDLDEVVATERHPSTWPAPAPAIIC